MDVDALLASPPLTSLDPDVISFLRESLASESSPSEAAELLQPFLADAELADEQQTLSLCERFAKAKCGGTGGYSTRRGPPQAATMAGLSQDTVSKEEDPVEAEVHPKAGKVVAGRSAGLRKAEKAALEEAALAPGARLELQERIDCQAIARAFKLGAPELRGWIEQDAQRLDMLGASFLAYAEERLPEKLPKWAQLLEELLEDAAVTASLDEDEELSKVAMKAVTQLVKSGLLVAKKRLCEVGDPVLALLPEDQDWHPAVVESIVEDRLKLIFIEYGKPQEIHMDEVRAMDDVADEGEEGEGECEMCERDLKLTFHHLIPKDKHPTYLGKRLPAGIEGEPTRYFLNAYGLMICRQCHNTVHNIASNEVLASQYNTLQKLMAHPVIQRWVDFAKTRRASGGKCR